MPPFESSGLQRELSQCASTISPTVSPKSYCYAIGIIQLFDIISNEWKVEASTGIEPVYTDLQSAASPLRQLAREQN